MPVLCACYAFVAMFVTIKRSAVLALAVRSCFYVRPQRRWANHRGPASAVSAPQDMHLSDSRLHASRPVPTVRDLSKLRSPSTNEHADGADSVASGHTAPHSFKGRMRTASRPASACASRPASACASRPASASAACSLSTCDTAVSPRPPLHRCAPHDEATIAELELQAAAQKAAAQRAAAQLAQVREEHLQAKCRVALLQRHLHEARRRVAAELVVATRQLAAAQVREARDARERRGQRQLRAGRPDHDSLPTSPSCRSRGARQRAHASPPVGGVSSAARDLHVPSFCELNARVQVSAPQAQLRRCAHVSRERLGTRFVEAERDPLAQVRASTRRLDAEARMLAAELLRYNGADWRPSTSVCRPALAGDFSVGRAQASAETLGAQTASFSAPKPAPLSAPKSAPRRAAGVQMQSARASPSLWVQVALACAPVERSGSSEGSDEKAMEPQGRCRGSNKERGRGISRTSKDERLELLSSKIASGYALLTDELHDLRCVRDAARAAKLRRRVDDGHEPTEKEAAFLARAAASEYQAKMRNLRSEIAQSQEEMADDLMRASVRPQFARLASAQRHCGLRGGVGLNATASKRRPASAAAK